MRQAGSARWALSFTDLCLVLLAFFVILQAHAAERGRVVESVRGAFGRAGAGPAPLTYAPGTLFEPGEAVFRPGASEMLGKIGQRAMTRGQRVAVTSVGVEQLARRFDGWELAAARAAAVARAVGSGGIADDRIDLSMVPLAQARGQQIQIVAR